MLVFGLTTTTPDGNEVTPSCCVTKTEGTPPAASVLHVLSSMVTGLERAQRRENHKCALDVEGCCMGSSLFAGKTGS